MGFLVGFLVVIAVVGALFYVLVIQREVPGVFEQRVGTLEALPPDVGKWTVDAESAEGQAAQAQGLKREVRLFYDQHRDKLIRQTRFRNQATNAIVRIDPDVPVPRRRIRS